MRLLWGTLVACTALQAQSPLNPERQISAVFQAVGEHAARLEPMVRQLRPEAWVAKGASDTYVAQLNSLLQQLTAVRAETISLAATPDRMTDGMKALFRLEATHQTLGSLLGGLRKYQNPALADLIDAVAAEDRGDLDKIRLYLLELAAEKEQQFTLVDKEAQRCRGMLSSQPAASPARRTR